MTEVASIRIYLLMSRSNSMPVPVIVSTIQHSSYGKTVIIEGADDFIVYRVLTIIFADKNIKVIPAGGRDNVLKIFEELQKLDCLHKAIFIVDQDSWVFTGIPPQYQHPRIICTTGYSIENDIYMDRNLEDLMHGTDVFSSFDTELKIYLEWFALAIQRYIKNKSEKLDIHPTNFFKNYKTYCTCKNGEVHPNPTYHELINSYQVKFRGKCLLPLAIRALGMRKESPSYHHKAIMEETAVSGRGVHLNRIFDAVNNLA